VKKVGHVGTLDPFATGLLIILLAPATRLAEYLLDLPKVYETEITLGATSTTDDSTGYITSPYQGDVPAMTGGEVLSRQYIETTLRSFTGPIQQVPPAYAATKIKGKRAYQYARAGDSVEQAPRKITIYEIKLRHYNYPTLQLQVTCGRGTYIRALARDIGVSLKTGGYCSTLRRLNIGQFAVKDAHQLADLPTKLSTTTLPDETLVDHLPKIMLSADNVAKFKQGKAVEVNSDLLPNTIYAILDTNSKLIGIGQPDPTTPTLLQPTKVLEGWAS
jgi:tRNA pseudouridine55 synthase